MTTLRVGDTAPDFTSVTQDGQPFTKADLMGQRTILYFYPKDNTSGCTLEAKSLRDGKAELAAMGFRIVGVSPDSERSHRNFCAKHELNFTLLADTDHSVCEAFGVWAEKSMYGRKVMDKIEKDFGKGSIMRMNSSEIVDVPVIPTGSITLDMALGVGGYPKGRVIEIYGPESSGKTTLAIHAIAEAQKAGGIAAFIDAEHAFDSFYAQKLGVDVDNLLISQPDNGEQALEIADSLIRSSAIDIIVIDSVAALTPKAEIEGDMGDSKMGLQARLMSQALRKLTASISKTKTVCIFINQLRDKIGVVYGNPETTTGGNALKFYASVRIDIRRMSVIKDGEEQLGTRTKVKVVKNKVAPPFKKAEFDIIFGEGISKIGEIIDLGVDYGVIKKSGSWFSYGDRKLGQGRDAVKELFKTDTALADEIETKVREAMKAPQQK